jgi:soluble lytic murein transglycosylase-like protein
VAAERDVSKLAALAVRAGPEAARRALFAALATDPAWAPLLAGEAPDPVALSAPLGALVAVGLEPLAATLYPHRFPAGTPQERAWSAHNLAAWGNPTAALAAGEGLWRAAGVPAVLLPDELLPHVLPNELVAPAVAAAHAAGTAPDLLVALLRRESRFDAQARSAAGALGIAQLVPETARRLGVDPEAAFAPDAALAAAATEVRRLTDAYGPRPFVVAAAYNAGDPVVASWLRWYREDGLAALVPAAIPYRETADYTLAVAEGLALARRLHTPCGPCP